MHTKEPPLMVDGRMIGKRAMAALMVGVIGVGLSGCAWPWQKRPQAAPPAWLDVMVDVTSGERVPVTEGQRTAFQKRVRERLQAGRIGLGQVDAVWLLEADRPAGDGEAGGYLVVYLQRPWQGKTGARPAAALLQYVEQRGHAPRTDRLYERWLGGGGTREAEELEAFFAAHPLQQPRPPNGAAGPRPTGDGAVLRVTQATATGGPAEMVTLSNPAVSNAAAADLVAALGQMIRAEGWVCRYERQIPLNAAVLYGRPGQVVVGAWVKGEVIKARVWDGSEARWVALKEGAWAPAVAPPEEPGPESASAAAGAPPKNALPDAEGWRAEPGDGHTNVWHYRPAGAHEAQWTGFVVPGMEFDTGRMHVEGTMLYAIHDGQLLALPVPEAAR